MIKGTLGLALMMGVPAHNLLGPPPPPMKSLDLPLPLIKQAAYKQANQGTNGFLKVLFEGLGNEDIKAPCHYEL